MVKHIHVPIPNQKSEFASSHVVEEGAVRTALTSQRHVAEHHRSAEAHFDEFSGDVGSRRGMRKE